MEKNKIKSVFGESISPMAAKQLEVNDKNVGTSAALAEGMELTLKSFDYIPNYQRIGEDAFNELEVTQQARYKKLESGLFEADNSYYACLTDGAVSQVSLRTLTSAAALPNEFTTDEHSLLIPAGKASVVMTKVLPYLNKTLKVEKVLEWKAGDDVNGRAQRFDGRAVLFSVVD